MAASVSASTLVGLLVCTSACLPCVAAGELVPLVASVAVCLVMLVLIVIMVVVGFAWRGMRDGWADRNKKVKMPRAYFLKKEEAKRKLINGSIRSQAPSSQAPPQHVQPGVPNKAVDTASWVQGWNQNAIKNVYEEQDVTMELGDENDKEFHIETTIVDNEVLDVGPYKNSGLSNIATPSSGDVYSEPYIYTTGDKGSSTTISNKGADISAAGDVYVAENFTNYPSSTNNSNSQEKLVKL